MQQVSEFKFLPFHHTIHNTRLDLGTSKVYKDKIHPRVSDFKKVSIEKVSQSCQSLTVPFFRERGGAVGREGGSLRPRVHQRVSV